MTFRNNNPVVIILSSKIFLILCLVLVIWVGVALSKEIYRKHETNKDLEAVKQEITELEKRNSELASLIEFFKDQTFIEKEARERLNLKKPGENVVIVVDDEQNAGPNGSIDLGKESGGKDALSEEEPQGPRELSNPEKWWHYIFGE